MCLILFAHAVHPRYRLVLAANRDEYYARPAAPAAPWPDDPEIVAGRDLQSGGTWLGVRCGGRWAALTNVRDPSPREDAPSRGHLVGDYLRGARPPEEYLRELRSRAAEYNGFNLLVGDARGVFWASNRAKRFHPQRLAPGVYGLSNHLLDTPWPKVRRGTRALRSLLADGAEPDPDALFQVLADRDPAPDADLPDTGVGRAWERVLSSPFITSPEYGTRASTVLLIDPGGQAELTERTFTPGAEHWTEACHHVRGDSPGA